MSGQHETAVGTAWGALSLLACWTQTCSVSGAGGCLCWELQFRVSGVACPGLTAGGLNLLQDGMIRLA